MPAALSLDEAVRILSEYEKELDVILSLGTRMPLSATDRAECQARFRRLKERFEEDISTYEAPARMHQGNGHIHTFVGALRAASNRIHVKWNANPQSANWSGDLFSAKSDITGYRRDLEELGATGPA